MALRKILFHLSMSLFHFLPQFGKTPLHLASSRGHIDTVRTLIELGANVHSTDDASIFIVIIFCVCVLFVFILNA